MTAATDSSVGLVFLEKKLTDAKEFEAVLVFRLEEIRREIADLERITAAVKMRIQEAA